MLGGSLSKLLYRPQNGQAEFRRAGRERSLLQAAFRAFQSEFFSLAFRFHKSAGATRRTAPGVKAQVEALRLV
jgi:hypothetical protein